MKSEHEGIKISIGCGYSQEEGYVGIDKADYGFNIIRDLKRGLPLCDNSVDEIRANSMLEHIHDDDDYVFIMNECLRVLKSSKKMYGIVPYWKGNSAHKDPTHCRYFDMKTFSYLEQANRWNYGFDKRWKVEYTNLRPGKDGEIEIIDFCLIANK